MKQWTHKEIVDIAAQWAKSRHGVVVKEFNTTHINNIPDVFAFTGEFSTMIECKVSRADFFADQHKYYRLDPSIWNMSNYKIYCAPKGLLSLDKDIPEKWGLLEVNEQGKAKLAVNIFHGYKSIFWFPITEYMRRQERGILYSIARRATIKGFMPDICQSVSSISNFSVPHD